MKNCRDINISHLKQFRDHQNFSTSVVCFRLLGNCTQFCYHFVTPYIFTGMLNEPEEESIKVSRLIQGLESDHDFDSQTITRCCDEIGTIIVNVEKYTRKSGELSNLKS